MSDKSTYMFSNTIAWQIEKSEGFVYILDVKNDKTYYLDGVSKDIWMCIDSVLSFENLVKNLQVKYNGVPFETLKQDSSELITNLLALNLIIEVKNNEI